MDPVVEHQLHPEFRKAKFRSFHHGWLLFTSEDDEHSWNFWNPVTYESVKLPPTNKKMVKSCIFTASPQNPQCKVLLSHHGAPTLSYCQPGDQEWVTYDYREKILEIYGNEKYEILKGDLLHQLACMDGVIYAMTSIEHLVSIEFDNQTGLKLSGVGLEEPNGKFFGIYWSFLFESFGELFTVYITENLNNDITNWNDIYGIEVFRFDFSQKIWLHVDNVGDRLIFLDIQGNCTSCLAADIGCKGNNKIHFIKSRDKLMYVYDLEKQTVLSSLPWPILQTPLYEQFWVMTYYPKLKLLQDEIRKAVEEHTKSVVKSHTNIDAISATSQYPCNLNLDILALIAKKLKPLDYLEFRAADKLFNSAAPLTKWSIRSIAGALKSPWLVNFGYNKNVFSFTDPMHNNSYCMMVPESLRGMLINGYKEGYLLMADSYNMFYLNPFTGKQEKLPTPLINDNRLSFSSSPSSSDCIAVNLYGDKTLKVDYLLAWKDSWDDQTLEGDYQGFKRNGPGVFHKKMLYYLGQGGKLGVLKFEANINSTIRFSFKVLEKPEVPVNAFYHNYLMECNKKLVAVFVGQNGNWVEVFRLDHIEMRWLKVRNLGNYTMFVSNTSSIAAVARSRGMENKIYFPRFYNERVVYYSLETKKFHTHGDNAVLKNFVDTKEHLYCTWIEANFLDPNEKIRPNQEAELECRLLLLRNF